MNVTTHAMAAAVSGGDVACGALGALMAQYAGKALKDHFGNDLTERQIIAIVQSGAAIFAGMLGKNPSEAAAAALVVMECDILRARGPSSQEIAEAERKEAEAAAKAEAEAQAAAEEEAARVEKRRLRSQEIARQNEKLRQDKEKLAAQAQEREAAKKRAAEEKEKQQLSLHEEDYRDMVHNAYGINPHPVPVPEDTPAKKVAPPKPQGLMDQVVEKGKAIASAGGDLLIEGMEEMVKLKRMGHRRRNSDTPRRETPFGKAVKKVEAFFGPDPDYVPPARAPGQGKGAYFMELYKEVYPHQYNVLFNGQGGLMQQAPLLDAAENAGIAIGFAAHEGGGYVRRGLRDGLGVDPEFAQNWGDIAKLWINLGMPGGGAAAGRVAGLAGRAARAAGDAGQKLMGKGANLLEALDLEVRAFPQGNKLQGPKVEFKMDLHPQGKQVMPKHEPPVLKKDLGAKPQAPNDVPVHGEPKQHNIIEKPINNGSLAEYAALKAKLYLQEVGMLNEFGALTPKAIAGAKALNLEGGIKNPYVISELTKDGSKIGDWAKYATKGIEYPLAAEGKGLQIHFYMNRITGKVHYNAGDFKVNYPVIFGAKLK